MEDYIANYIEEIQLSGELKKLKDNMMTEENPKHWMETVAEKFDVHPDVVSITYYRMISGQQNPKFLKSYEAERAEEKRKEKERGDAWVAKMKKDIDNMTPEQKEHLKENADEILGMIDKILKLC